MSSHLVEKKIRYDMKNLSGGFSDGVDIETGRTPGTISLSVNIYGGGANVKHTIKLPDKIAKLQSAYIMAVKNNDPTAKELKLQLNSYYNLIKKALSTQVSKMLMDFDSEFGRRMRMIIKKINARY